MHIIGNLKLENLSSNIAYSCVDVNMSFIIRCKSIPHKNEIVQYGERVSTAECKRYVLHIVNYNRMSHFPDGFYS